MDKEDIFVVWGMLQKMHKLRLIAWDEAIEIYRESIWRMHEKK